MADETGFKIGDRIYPLPEAYGSLDPVLVYEATGLDFQDFAERLQNIDGMKTDFVALQGVVAVSIWHGNPDWTRQKVLKFMQNLDISSYEFVSAEGEADAGPPAVADSLSPGSSEPSSPDSNENSVTTGTDGSSGQSRLDSASPHSLHAA